MPLTLTSTALGCSLIKVNRAALGDSVVVVTANRVVVVVTGGRVVVDCGEAVVEGGAVVVVDACALGGEVDEDTVTGVVGGRGVPEVPPADTTSLSGPLDRHPPSTNPAMTSTVAPI